MTCRVFVYVSEAFGTFYLFWERVRSAHTRYEICIHTLGEMRQLIEMGVDCIMTDDPILLKSVLEEYE